MRKSLVCLACLMSLLMFSVVNAQTVEKIITVGGGTISDVYVGDHFMFNVPVPDDIPEQARLLGWTVTFNITAESYLFISMDQKPPPPPAYVVNDPYGAAKVAYEMYLNGEDISFAVNNVNFGAITYNTGTYLSTESASSPVGIFSVSGDEHLPGVFDLYLAGTKATGLTNGSGLDPQITGWGPSVTAYLQAGGTYQITYTYDWTEVPTPTPEPATMLILLGGLAACPLARRFRKK